MADPQDSPSDAAAREAFARLSGRSPLLGWMRQNHALITERMNTARPSWDDVTRTLGELGVRDANGAPPKQDAVRRAYHRVAGALDAKGHRRRRTGEQVAADRAAASPPPAALGEGPAPTAAPVRPAPIRPAIPSGAAPVPATASPSPARPAFDPTEGAFDPKPPPRFRPASLK